MASIIFTIVGRVSRNLAAYWFVAVMIGAFPAIAADQQVPLTIRSTAASHIFHVEVMRTPEGRARGLMYRRQLDADAGMLFDFQEPQIARMWMKNTYIPLDMLFIRENGEIANIIKNTVPEALSVLSSEGKVRYVLELNGGTSERFGILPGDQVGLASNK